MTYDDDHVQLHTFAGRRFVMCKQNGIEWPPPEVLEIGGFTWKRESYSQLTDEQRAGLTHVSRGAAYVPCDGNPLGLD